MQGICIASTPDPVAVANEGLVPESLMVVTGMGGRYIQDPTINSQRSSNNTCHVNIDSKQVTIGYPKRVSNRTRWVNRTDPLQMEVDGINGPPGRMAEINK